MSWRQRTVSGREMPASDLPVKLAQEFVCFCDRFCGTRDCTSACSSGTTCSLFSHGALSLKLGENLGWGDCGPPDVLDGSSHLLPPLWPMVKDDGSSSSHRFPISGVKQCFDMLKAPPACGRALLDLGHKIQAA